MLRAFRLLLSYMLLAYYVMVIASWFFIGADGDVTTSNPSGTDLNSPEADDNLSEIIWKIISGSLALT
ncbi:MAG: hypothetical protein II472_04030 [Lachnospiraceae bacterium]|nr:hypothetical protein [Lachnospiraceae bacterium]